MSTAYTFVFILLVAGAFMVVTLLSRKRGLTRRPVWDGGLRRLFPDMTYTATGFSNPVRVVFDAIFRPTTVEDIRETVAEHFRTAIGGDRYETHMIDRIIYQPTTRFMNWSAKRAARMHVGKINTYAAYVLLTLLLFLLISHLL